MQDQGEGQAGRVQEGHSGFMGRLGGEHRGYFVVRGPRAGADLQCRTSAGQGEVAPCWSSGQPQQPLAPPFTICL